MYFIWSFYYHCPFKHPHGTFSLLQAPDTEQMFFSDRWIKHWPFGDAKLENLEQDIVLSIRLSVYLKKYTGNEWYQKEYTVYILILLRLSHTTYFIQSVTTIVVNQSWCVHVLFGKQGTWVSPRETESRFSLLRSHVFLMGWVRMSWKISDGWTAVHIEINILNKWPPQNKAIKLLNKAIS